MNHRVRLLCLLICLLLPGAVASGQSSIPSSVKSASNAEQHRTVIAAFIKAQARRIAGGKPAAIRAGREAIEVQASAANPSASFLDVYAEELNRVMVPLAKNKNLLVRLNAAIANARVAERVKNGRLQGGTLLFLNDPSDAVALWGVKAARHVLPHVLNLGGGAVQDRLSPAIVDLVKRHPKVGAIAEEAYEALSLPIGGNNPNQRAVIQAVAPHMLDLFTFRVGLYTKGVPSMPTADTRATRFLSHTTVWGTLNAEQQLQTMQQTANLISAAAQQALELEPNLRRPLIEVIDLSAAALQVIAKREKEQALLEFAPTIRGLGPGSEEGLDRAREIHDKINEGAKFEVKPLPQVTTSEPVDLEELTEEEEAGGDTAPDDDVDDAPETDDLPDLDDATEADDAAETSAAPATDAASAAVALDHEAADLAAPARRLRRG